MLSYDDDDIPLAVVKAKSSKPVVSSSKAQDSQATKDTKKPPTSNQNKDVRVKPKVSSQDAPASKDSKRINKDAKKTNVSSEWADFDNQSSASSKKSKTLFEWARSHTTFLIFMALVVFLVACRCARAHLFSDRSQR